MALIPNGPFGGHAGRGGLAAPPLLSEINVTPLVDVMLVLLVIFMITAPLVATGVKVDLPQARTRELASDQKPLVITMDAVGTVFIGDAPVAHEALGSTLRGLAQASGDPAQLRIFVRADRTIAYGTVMQFVAEIAAAGFTKVAFLSDSHEPPEERAAP